MEMSMDVDMEVDVEMEEIGEDYIDFFCESIDAPMYVDFTLPLPELDDSPAWFCHPTGCTKNHDEDICELPVVVARKSKLAEVLAARKNRLAQISQPLSNAKIGDLLQEKVAVRKLAGTKKPSEILRRPLVEQPKLSKPKLASVCSATNIIQTKASGSRVAPSYISSLGVKARGNAKVGGSLKEEKKGEVKALFQGASTNVNADMKNVKVGQQTNAKSRYVAEKHSSISLMKSKSMKNTNVFQNRDNKKDNLGKKMITWNEKEEDNPTTRQIYDLTTVEWKATRDSGSYLHAKGEKSKSTVVATKGSKMPLLKEGLNGN